MYTYLFILLPRNCVKIFCEISVFSQYKIDISYRIAEMDAVMQIVGIMKIIVFKSKNL